MNSTIILLLLVFSVVMAAPLSVEEQWKNFKSTFNKAYENEEEETKRRAVFENNLQKIEEHNKKYEKGEVTWKMGINKFVDLTPEEMKRYNGVLKPKSGLATVV